MEVIRALVALVQMEPRVQEVMQRVLSDCAKLTSIASRETFKEADFMRTVRAVAGDQGVLVCRSLLDGTDAAQETERALHSIVTSGRCLVCKSSTFEDDCPSDGVLLCDGCNAGAAGHTQSIGSA